MEIQLRESLLLEQFSEHLECVDVELFKDYLYSTTAVMIEVFAFCWILKDLHSLL